jgi:hypothetical protein
MPALIQGQVAVAQEQLGPLVELLERWVMVEQGRIKLWV